MYYSNKHIHSGFMVLIIRRNINIVELQSFTEILNLYYNHTTPWGTRSPLMTSIIHIHIIFKHNLLYRHKELKAEERERELDSH